MFSVAEYGTADNEFVLKSSLSPFHFFFLFSTQIKRHIENISCVNKTIGKSETTNETKIGKDQKRS